MHFIMILVAFGLAWGIRLVSINPAGSWNQRWRKTLFFFLFPSLLLIMTALAILAMGPQGKMLGLQASWFSYWLSLLFLVVLGVSGCKSIFQGWQVWRQVCTYSQQMVEGQRVRILETSLPYSAQVGFWQSELVVSQGLLEMLGREHIQAVLAHEQAHGYYRDTFWFFWLSWLRASTAWLPNTEAWWQELLLLREQRADCRAAQQVDALLLAESLLIVAQAPLLSFPSFGVPFSCALPRCRLAERIDGLVNSEATPASANPWTWSWLLLLSIPWIAVPFHY